jgi:hypothetical protein
VTAAPSASVTGQQVTFTATVAVVAPGTGTPPGTVTFSDGGGTLCSDVPLSATSPFTATCQVAYPKAGMDTVSAGYPGTPDFAASSGSTNVSTGLGSTQVVLQSSDNPASTGEEPTFTATVQPVAPASGTPGGTVTFSFSAVSGMAAPACTGGDTVHLVSGTATCTLSTGLVPRASPITVGADYSGSNAFSSSAAPPLTETVGVATTTLKLSSSANPLTQGSAVTFKAKVAVTAPGSGTPIGTINWTITNAQGKSISCASVATVDTTALKSTCTISAGAFVTAKSPYTVTATYGGTSKFDGSTATLTEVVTGG